MGHGDTDTGLEKLKETLKDLVYSNKLIQVLIDPPSPTPLQRQLEMVILITR